LRREVPAIASGDLRMLPTDDADVVALGRRGAASAALVLINRDSSAHSVAITTAGFVPDGSVLSSLLVAPAGKDVTASTSDGKLSLLIMPMTGLVLATDPAADLTAPGSPQGLEVTTELEG